MEKILKIEEITEHGGSYDGFKIITDRQEIYFLIDGFQSCCESWGYFSCSDDMEDFVGSNLASIEAVDECLNKQKLSDIIGFELDNPYSFDAGGIYFLNINTDTKGTLQLAVYNAHNGYYGHTVKVISEQLKEETYL